MKQSVEFILTHVDHGVVLIYRGFPRAHLLQVDSILNTGSVGDVIIDKLECGADLTASEGAVVEEHSFDVVVPRAAVAIFRKAAASQEMGVFSELEDRARGAFDAILEIVGNEMNRWTGVD